MKSTFMGFIALILISTLGCKKDADGDESALYGTWVKGSYFGDTLWFMKKNGKNIMRIIDSFNPQMARYVEKEYRFRNGMLDIKSFAPGSQHYFPITSFSWTDPRKEFSVQSTQLFMIMSAMVTFTYRKI